MLDAGFGYEIVLSVLVGISLYLNFLCASMIRTLRKDMNDLGEILSKSNIETLKWCKQHAEISEIKEAQMKSDITDIKRRLSILGYYEHKHTWSEIIDPPMDKGFDEAF